jgi:tetratricopeptide (TPR) repeat protein
MELSGIAWADGALNFVSWVIGLVAAALVGVWRRLVELRAGYPELLSPQTLFGLVGTGLGIWRWWESREARLFRHFEQMIEGQEAQLVKARSDLLDVLIRPGPGLHIRPPLFAQKALRLVLSRRKWHSALSVLPVAQSVDTKLHAAVGTCDRKVSAHLKRLAFFRQEIASAHLIQGALAAARAVNARETHEQQRLSQDALDCFRKVLTVPGHKDDLAALELVAHQLRCIDGQSQAAIDAYLALIDTIQRQQESPTRNLLLARAKRSLAILRYPRAPGVAQGLLADAVDLLIEFGPRRDRDLLELAETVHLDALARLRLRMTLQGPQQLSLAEGHYRDLLRSLRARRRGLFRWMRREGRYSGHRVAELRARRARSRSGQTLDESEQQTAGAAHCQPIDRKRNTKPQPYAMVLATSALMRLRRSVWSIASCNPRLAARRKSR